MEMWRRIRENIAGQKTNNRPLERFLLFIQDPYLFFFFSCDSLCFPTSTLIISAMWRDGSECNTALPELPFHLPASKTRLWSRRTPLFFLFFGDGAAQTVCIQYMFGWFRFQITQRAYLSWSCRLLCPTRRPNAESSTFFQTVRNVTILPQKKQNNKHLLWLTCLFALFQFHLL